MRNIIQIVIMFLLVVSGTGCSVQQKMIRKMGGDPNQTIALYDDTIGSFDNWSKIVELDMGVLCKAYYQTRQYDKAQNCLNYYEKIELPKFIKKYRSTESSRTSWRHVYDVVFYELKSSILLDLGLYQKAYQYASRGVEIASCRKNEPYNLCTNPHNAALIYSNKAIAAVKLGKLNEANALAKGIPKFYFVNWLGIKVGNGSSIYKKITNAAEARAYIALNDFDNADIAIKKGSTGAMDVFSRVTLGLMSFGATELTKLSSVTDPFVINNIYMQAKICLKKEKLECAKKGYDALISGSRNWSDLYNDQSVNPGSYTLQRCLPRLVSR